MKSNYKLKFIEKKNIPKDDNSSEWINIDLPATTYLFENVEKILFKRIMSYTGKIVWRISNNSSWITITGDCLMKYQKEYDKYLREEKLERILNINNE